jgi:RHS repeat-associated protein
MKSPIKIKALLSGKSGLFPALLFFSSVGYAQSPATLPAAYTGTTLNWTRVWSATAPETNPANLLIRPLTDVKQVTKYFDGFGRPMETVSKDASPAGNDMVTAHCYDPATGNEIYKYLPFTSNAATSGDITNDGNFKFDRFQQQAAFYNTYLSGQQNETNVGSGGTNWAYSQTGYETSPLNRVLSTYAPGANWVGSQSSSTAHSQQQEFLLNTVNDSVQIWNIPGWSISNPELTTSIIPANGGAYAAGKLYKTIATDELGLQTVEFKDMYGQVILRKVQLQPSATSYAPFDNGTGRGPTGWLCTYFVYDDHGNLRFVITPNVVAQLVAAGNWSISQAQADELCYRFEYDQLNHMIVKKTPGTPTGTQGEIWMVYDERNRMVMEQDGNMRANKQWLYLEYDNLNRLIAKGFISDPTYYNVLSYHVGKAAVSSNTSAGVSAWPLSSYSSSELLAQVYYDNYTNIPSPLPQTLDVTTNGEGNSAFTTSYNVTPTYAQPITQSLMTQGMATGSKLEVLGTSGGQYIPSVTFYDEKARVIQTQSINYTTGKDIATTQYSWSGEPLTTLMSQNYVSSSNPQTHLVVTAIGYDAMNRLDSVTKTVTSTINGVAVSSAATRISKEQYDESSRLLEKTLGNSLETLTYGYNVRGWPLGFNQNYISGSSTSHYFGLELAYDKSSSVAPGNSYLYPIFNGNVAGSVWKSEGDGINRKYDFTYDNANRLAAGAYLQNTTASAWDKSFIDFSVSGITYDANGNITAMHQNGFAQGGVIPVDELSYNYVNGAGNSNRLVYVNDSANVTNSTLGDFHFPGSAKTSSSVDYTYDANANTISDNNRSIASITYYSYPSLPNLITTNMGTIQYFYDAAGNKMKKVVTQTHDTVNSVPTSVSDTLKYVNGFVYKSLTYTASALTAQNYTGVLQYLGDEEGRLRFKAATGSIPASFVHDYMIRDHLGNVRVGITDEAAQDDYPAATGETTSETVGGVTSDAQNYEAQYYSFNPSDFIATSTLPAWFSSMTGSNYTNENDGGTPVNNDPYSVVTAVSQKVLQLCGNTANNPTGDNNSLGVTLKVMAGDVVNIYGLSFWNNTGTLPSGSYPVSSVLTSLLTAFGSSTAVTSTLSHDGLGSGAFNSSSTSPTYNLLFPMLNDSSVQSGTQAPYAGVNWIIFDDQFRPVSVGFDPVSTTTDNIKNHNRTVTIPKNGYIYVYVSNQSNINVYFDNLQVVENHGPLLEETHYYPYGLTMAGISDRAWNKQPNYFHYEGNEMQDEEWGNGTGLEEYDFHARFYDQQIGRWNTQDPIVNAESPYSAMANNPANLTDANGKCPICIVLIVAAIVGGTLDDMANSGNIHNFWQGAGYFLAGAIAADAVVLSDGSDAALFGTASSTAGSLAAQGWVGSTLADFGSFMGAGSASGGLAADFFGSFSPIAFSIGGAAQIAADGADRGFKNLNFGQYVGDFLYGGLNGMSGASTANSLTGLVGIKAPGGGVLLNSANFNPDYNGSQYTSDAGKIFGAVPATFSWGDIASSVFKTELSSYAQYLYDPIHHSSPWSTSNQIQSVLLTWGGDTFAGIKQVPGYGSILMNYFLNSIEQISAAARNSP